VKKQIIAALSLGFMGAMSGAQAAPVTIDAGNFEITYQDQLLAGLSISFANGVFSISGPGLPVNAADNGEPVVGELSTNSYSGVFPILLTPKAGYQISGLTESVKGSYSAAVGEQGMAAVSAGLVSRWVYTNGVEPLGQNTPATIAAFLKTGDAPVQGNFEASGTLDFSTAISELNLAPGTVGLSDLYVYVGALAGGSGSQASGLLTSYQFGVAVTAVPEPEAIAMLLAGLGVVGFAMRRRASKR
jgi:hypothetical protein